MKLKNTLSVVIGSFVAATSFGALAQGQGAVEVEAFSKRYFTDSYRDMSNGYLYGGSLGYFLTDDVELALSYGEYHDIRSSSETGNKNIKGSMTGLDAIYHFGKPGHGRNDGLRPYVSAGFSHQSIGNVPPRGGRDHSTFANVGAGLKFYFTNNFYARAGVDGMYNIDDSQGEWATSVGIGLNFGGSPAAAAVVVAAVDPMPEPIEEPMEIVRVELDVKFDFDKDRVKPESYGDIKALADFMNQYPQTTTTVEGHTDGTGSEKYNQTLSERRAKAVRSVLVDEYGVESERVNAVGYGESRPVADNATAEGRAINRRVEAEVEADVPVE